MNLDLLFTLAASALFAGFITPWFSAKAKKKVNSVNQDRALERIKSEPLIFARTITEEGKVVHGTKLDRLYDLNGVDILDGNYYEIIIIEKGRIVIQEKNKGFFMTFTVEEFEAMHPIIKG